MWRAPESAPRPLCRAPSLATPIPAPSHACRCSLELGVSTEAIARARFFPKLKAAMAKLPAKMWEIDGEAPVEVVEADDPRGHGPRVAEVRAQIDLSRRPSLRARAHYEEHFAVGGYLQARPCEIALVNEMPTQIRRTQ